MKTILFIVGQVFWTGAVVFVTMTWTADQHRQAYQSIQTAEVLEAKRLIDERLAEREAINLEWVEKFRLMEKAMKAKNSIIRELEQQVEIKRQHVAVIEAQQATVPVLEASVSNAELLSVLAGMGIKASVRGGK